MQSHLKGLMLLTRISCHGNGSRSPLPNSHKKHRNKGYFDQNNTVRIPNVTHVVHKVYIIANKVQKLQRTDD